MKLTMILLLILMLLTFLLIQLTHLLWMGLTLMINTIITSLMIVTLSESPWFSYVIFLVFLGGVLVLFTYVTSSASNEMFRLNTKTMILAPIIVVMIIAITADPYLTANPHPLQDSLHTFIEQQEIPSMKFYNKSMAYWLMAQTITLTRATYLFIILLQ